ncbi:hypothetical protein I4U23_005906 [Adineta vaga]|nr:hypothetical protein I4U23_005906 [Adineta vaga]
MLFRFIFLVFLSTNALPLNDLFPFGSESNDSMIYQSSFNISSGPLDLPYIFPYFDDLNTQISITNNGLFVFGSILNSYSYYTPNRFPLRDGSSIIAGYWHNHIYNYMNETKNQVYYQIYSNSSASNSAMKVFMKASDYVQRYFPQQRLFQPKMVITGTWYYISSSEYNNTDRLNNTFQIVLTTNEDLSFVFLLYHELQWGNSDNYSYYSIQAGFNNDHRNISELLPYSGTNEIIKLANESNVNVPGLYVYRVDAHEINAGGCFENTSIVSFRPRIGSQLGSTVLNIYGPCFTNQNKIKCRFNTLPLKIVDGFIIDEFRAICLTPFVSIDGSIVVDISIDNGQTFLSAGSFNFVSAQLDSSEVSVEMENGQKLPNAGEYITLKWRFTDIIKNTFPNGTIIDVELWKVNLNNQAQLQKSDLPEILASNLSLHNSVRVRIPEGISTGFIRIVARYNSYIYSGLNSDLLIISSSPVSAAESCQNWSKQEVEPSAWNSNGLLPCPMSTDQAKRAGFCCYEPESHCYKGSKNPNNCWLHQGRPERNESSAVECYISKYSNNHGASAQCCYGADGMIITRGQGAGTDDRYGPIISPVKHFFHDILPYLQCCIISTDSETCHTYMKYRPPRRGSNTMGESGRMWGDPHFGTLDDLSYTFNGYGEYTYLAITNNFAPLPEFNATSQSYVFMSQIRTVPIAVSTGNATVTTGFAARSNDAEAQPISLTISSRQQIVLHRNNTILEFEDNINAFTFPELIITRQNDQKYIFSWNIGVTIVIKIIQMTSPSKKFILDISASISGNFRYKTYGLLGTYDGNKDNDLRSRNGTVLNSNSSIEQIHKNFGITWAIDPQTSMFSYEPHETAQWFRDQNDNFIPSFAQLSSNNSSHRLTCGIDATSPETSWTPAERTCYYDLSVTNDRQFARESLAAGNEFKIMKAPSSIYPVFHSSLPLIMNLNEGDSVKFNVSVSSDNPTHSITLSTIHLPRKATFIVSTHTFIWTAIKGDDYLSIQAHDQTNNLTTKHDITFHVTPFHRSNSNDVKGIQLLILILTFFIIF